MSKYIISSRKSEQICSKFFEWSFGKDDDFVPSKSDFSLLNHSAELHYLAYIYNWDDGHIVLKWVLQSPLCSRSTANLLFWRSLPSYFEKTNFSDPETCPDYCEAGFELIPIVLERYSNLDFSTENIAFDPTDEIEHLEHKKFDWEIPKGVYDKISGIEVYVDE